MAIKSYIALNFFPLENQDFEITVYRRICLQPRAKLDSTRERCYKLGQPFCIYTRKTLNPS